MCGENYKKRVADDIHKGSPPHVRGKRVVIVVTYEIRGITPACAGKTFCRKNQHFQIEDHPRMCGEN